MKTHCRSNDKYRFRKKRLFVLWLLLSATFSHGATLSVGRWQKGEGEFIFKAYAPLESKPIRVYYYIPKKGQIENMPVLIAVHGNERTGKTNISNWKEFAERDGFVVIAPEFSRKLYPVNDYQYGGVFPKVGATDMSPRALWTYNMIESLFDDFLRATGSRATTYDLWGHSAGAQFTHRLLLTMPEARVRRAAAANAGSWTFPVEGVEAASGEVYDWPYSVKGTPFGSRKNLEVFFARDLTICLGLADTLTNTSDFPKSEESMAQGNTRVERGHNFYNSARQTAAEMGLPFNWKLVEVEGIGHTGKGMIFGRSEKAGDKELFSIDNCAPISGYGVLFGDANPQQRAPDTEKLFEKKYIKSMIEKVTLWQLANPKHEPRDWTNGAFYAGVFAAWETTKSKDIYRAMIDMGEKAQWLPYRRWFHADDIVISQTYIDLYRKEKRHAMIQPTIDTLAKFMANPYPVRGIEVIKWWWCDALFMGPPAMIKMGITLKDNEYLFKCDEYFKECYDLLYHKDEHLFARDLNYVIKNDGKDRYEANGKRIFWSRGNGWVMGGLVRILKELPENYPQRPFYEQLFKEMATKIMSLQQSDGLWRASLLDPDSYPGGEVSGSGFFCYAFAWGINNGLLDQKSFRPVVEKAWNALNRCVNDEGRVGWVQPIGADPRKNFDADSWEVYGTGAFLLAGSEVIKMKR